MEDQKDAASTRKTAHSALRVAARHRRAGIRDNNPVRRSRSLQGRLGGRQYVQCWRLRQVQRRYLHLSSNPHGSCWRKLESGLDAVVVVHGRIVHRRHAHSDTGVHSDTSVYSDTSAYSDTNTDPEPGPGMQRGSDLDRDCDLYGWPAREPERRPLRSQVVDSKPEPGDQLRPGWPLAAYRPLRHADADASSHANSCAHTDTITAADRVA